MRLANYCMREGGVVFKTSKKILYRLLVLVAGAPGKDIVGIRGSRLLLRASCCVKLVARVV